MQRDAGGDVDDVALSPFDHVPRGGLGRIHHALEVGFQQVVQVHGGVFDEGLG
ncbi:hypothetical protein D9M68_916350 [compost metagenome]